MSEPKPIASLSSGLLARKGAARPAMRPQGFGQAGASLDDLGWNDMGFEPPKPAVVSLRDSNHDAFGDEIEGEPRVHPTGLTPVQSPVHNQHAAIADRLGIDEAEALDEAEDYEGAAAFAEEAAPVESTQAPETAPAATAAIATPSPRRAPAPRSAPGSKAKAAFTLRLDPPRHLKLRLACAVGGRSAQQLVTDALDQFLAAMPELDAMAEKAKRKG